MNDLPDYTDLALGALGGLRRRSEDPHKPLGITDPKSLFGVPVPERRWIVQEWLPVGHTTLNFGDGGVGKTLLAQQLMTACATGTPWCGLAVEKCRAFALFCEDDPEELHRRQDAINAHLGLNFGDLGGMRWASGVGEDNVLADFDHDGNMLLTDRYHEVVRAARDFGARLVILDTAADLFGGNENDRKQVKRFIGRALTGLAQAIDGAVLLNAHPSRSGMSSGSGDGASTSWSNSARSRWYLTRPEAADCEQADPNERVLTKLKANFSTIGDAIRLRWHRGVLVSPDTGADRFNAASRKAECEAVFMSLLTRSIAQGRTVGIAKNAGNFGPTIFSKAPDRAGFTRREFEYAMEALLAGRLILAEQYGPPSKRMTKLVLPDEKEGV